ncbi:(wild Malaysian banana) hypothetical protein [Balamuthia mandrillaris]
MQSQCLVPGGHAPVGLGGVLLLPSLAKALSSLCGIKLVHVLPASSSASQLPSSFVLLNFTEAALLTTSNPQKESCSYLAPYFLEEEESVATFKYRLSRSMHLPIARIELYYGPEKDEAEDQEAEQKKRNAAAKKSDMKWETWSALMSKDEEKESLLSLLRRKRCRTMRFGKLASAHGLLLHLRLTGDDHLASQKHKREQQPQKQVSSTPSSSAAFLNGRRASRGKKKRIVYVELSALSKQNDRLHIKQSTTRSTERDEEERQRKGEEEEKEEGEVWNVIRLKEENKEQTKDETYYLPLTSSMKDNHKEDVLELLQDALLPLSSSLGGDLKDSLQNLQVFKLASSSSSTKEGTIALEPTTQLHAVSLSQLTERSKRSYPSVRSSSSFASVEEAARMATSVPVLQRGRGGNNKRAKVMLQLRYMKTDNLQNKQQTSMELSALLLSVYSSPLNDQLGEQSSQNETIMNATESIEDEEEEAEEEEGTVELWPSWSAKEMEEPRLSKAGRVVAFLEDASLFIWILLFVFFSWSYYFDAWSVSSLSGHGFALL